MNENTYFFIDFILKLISDADIDENVLKEIPFQLQIIYTAKDGSKALRILTQMKPLTSDRKLAEAGKYEFLKENL